MLKKNQAAESIKKKNSKVRSVKVVHMWELSMLQMQWFK